MRTAILASMARGSVSRRSGGWCFRLDAGVDAATGHRHQISRQGFRDQTRRRRSVEQRAGRIERDSAPGRRGRRCHVEELSLRMAREARIALRTSFPVSTEAPRTSSTDSLCPDQVDRRAADASRLDAAGRPRRPGLLCRVWPGELRLLAWEADGRLQIVARGVSGSLNGGARAPAVRSVRCVPASVGSGPRPLAACVVHPDPSRIGVSTLPLRASRVGTADA